MNKVPFLSPTFPAADDVARQYAEIVANGIYTNSGPKERQLALALAQAVGPGVGASLVSNATVALQLACSVVFHPGRRFVLVPSFTFAAGPLAARWCGYEVVFIDIDADTWQPTIEGATEFLADHPGDVAGILMTQTFGVGAEHVARWEALAEAHGVPLVLDSAAGFGSTYADGQPLGSRGNCEIFSLHATKMLAIGEGGAITSSDAALIAQLDRLKNFGFDGSRSSTGLGTNAKLDELSAAIGLLQLQQLAPRIRRRQQVVLRYRQALTPLGFTMQPGVERSAPAFMPAVTPVGAGRDRLVAALGDAGVECRAYYNPPVHEQPYFAGCAAIGDLSVTSQLSQRVISLPMSDHLADETVDGIAAAIADHLENS